MDTEHTDRDDARMAAYVSRVAALTPAEWGRLDAIGARLGGDAAARCLEYGFDALARRAMLPAASFDRVYAVVEPVIPLASLDPAR